MSKNIYLSLQVIIVTLFVLFIFPNIVRHGMFEDGVIYATIGRNMALDFGSFWTPRFTETFFYSFYEQPPLAMGLQALLFKVFGTQMFVERLYVSLIAVLNLHLIISIWRLVFRDNETLLRLWFIPIFFWLIDENTFLSYAANLLDCTMSVFTLFSVLFLLKSLKTQYLPIRILNILIGSVSIFLAVLSKGPVGLFPLAFFLIYLVTYKSIDFKQFIKYTAILVGGLVLAFGILFMFTNAKEFLIKYFNIQVLASLTGERRVTSHWYIVKRFFEMGLAPMLITVIIFTYSSWRKKKVIIIFKKEFLFFLFTALSASLPIILSPKQMGFYLVPAQPFYYLAFAALILPNLQMYFNKITDRKGFHFKSTLIAGILIIVTVIFTGINFGKINKRDKELIPDIHKIADITGGNKTIGGISLVRHWYSIGYFSRYHNISIDIENFNSHDYLVVSKSNDKVLINGFSKIELNTELYNLYVKVEN